MAEYDRGDGREAIGCRREAIGGEAIGYRLSVLGGRLMVQLSIISYQSGCCFSAAVFVYRDGAPTVNHRSGSREIPNINYDRHHHSPTTAN